MLVSRIFSLVYKRHDVCILTVSDSCDTGQVPLWDITVKLVGIEEHCNTHCKANNKRRERSPQIQKVNIRIDLQKVDDIHFMNVWIRYYKHTTKDKEKEKQRHTCHHIGDTFRDPLWDITVELIRFGKHFVKQRKAGQKNWTKNSKLY